MRRRKHSNLDLAARLHLSTTANYNDILAVDDDDDVAEGYSKAEQSRRRALTELYRQAKLLENFKMLNYTGGKVYGRAAFLLLTRPHVCSRCQDYQKARQNHEQVLR